MHAFAVLLVPHYEVHASLRPPEARDAAALARLDTLLCRFEQPEDQAWGVDHGEGFKFDWWEVGGNWSGWGRNLRALMRKQRLRPSRRPIPRCLERNAVWSEDLGRVRLGAAVFPLAVVTPHGDWEECAVWPGWGKPTVRERKAKAAWLRRIRRLMWAYPGCLAVGVDYHS